MTPSTELYRITGWGRWKDIKFSIMKHILILKLPQVLLNNLKTTHFLQSGKSATKRDGSKKLIFKPVRMPGDISKYLGGSAGMPAILIEKHRADQQGNIVQIDIEYWRFEAVDLIINL
ncbi:UTRA domain-containing protein [Escherichia coli]|nr:UTRA domain-containing protein [Escherichia coli]MDX1833960.1 UTRA domain-containing protein [Escherichia coli]MDX1860248.1 UTRA domain-containing protein [Escherichia coli]